jgi:hypothetical protein
MVKKRHPDDLEILEDLKEKLYGAILNDTPLPKVGDLLKVIEMKNKLSVTAKAEKKFWDMIDEIRKEELSGKKRSVSRKSKDSKKS